MIILLQIPWLCGQMILAMRETSSKIKVEAKADELWTILLLFKLSPMDL